MKYLVSLMLLLSLVACKGSKGTTKAEPPQTPETPVVESADQMYRLSVSFISIGAGIDHKSKTAYDAWIKEFESQNKVTLAHETVGWGREGEVDYCFLLKELKPAQQTEFINTTKKTFEGNTLVHIKENTACRKPR